MRLKKSAFLVRSSHFIGSLPHSGYILCSFDVVEKCLAHGGREAQLILFRLAG